MNRNEAYTSLLQRHRKMVWRMCWVHSGGSMELCRDLMQEVSIALWLHFGELLPNSSRGEERAWVYWVTRTTINHQLRRPCVEMQRLTPAHTDNLVDDDSLREREVVDDMMASLSPDEQRIMRLRMEGYRADEIASILGLNRDAVYQRMRRVIVKARRAMLLVLMLLVTTTLAVAVVPQWRHAVFGEPKPAVEETPRDSVVSTLAKIQPSDGMPPCYECCEEATLERQSVERLMSENVHSVMLRLNSISDTIPSSVSPLSPLPTIHVTDNHIVVSGIYGERVTIRRMNGTMLSSQVCNGFCVFTIFPDGEYFYAQNKYQIQIGSRPVMVLEL